MKLMAVICEYNPFHNGHAYQLKTQKEALNADAVIGIMSGSFVQRGEPSVVDKWARAEMALSGGCDLVLELPVVYSLQSAEGFAHGAVSMLSALGISGYLAFGSESGEVERLQASAKACLRPEYHEALQQFLQEGESYPQACQKALFAIDRALAEGLENRPNDILGIEYCKAIETTGAQLVPAAIKRIGAHDSSVSEGNFLSATGIRSCIEKGSDIVPFMPESALSIMKREEAAGRGPVFVDSLDLLIRYVFTQKKPCELSNISGMSEGLENRLIRAAKEYESFRAISEAAKTKRYPQTRIKRAMLNALLGITKDDERLLPAYARILGFTNRGADVIREVKKKAQIPFINKVADATFSDPDAARMFELDCLATDVYSLLYPQKKAGKCGMDFYRSPVLMTTYSN